MRPRLHTAREQADWGLDPLGDSLHDVAALVQLPLFVLAFALIVLGAVGYFATGRVSITAWIPAFFGVPLAALAAIATATGAPAWCSWAALAIVSLGLLGTVRGLAQWLRSAQATAATKSKGLMALFCALYLAYFLLA